MRLTFAILACLAATAFLPGCTKDGQYYGPTVSRVGVTGSYTDKEGESFGGGVNADLAYPSPSPAPKRVDHSK